MDNLYSIIVNGTPQEYINIKYSSYGEGDIVSFKDKVFENLDLTNFPLAFTIFENCTLTNVKISGLPIGFKNSKAKLNLKGSKVTIIAEDTDFSGTLYDENTVLSNKEDEQNISVFSRCKLDENFKIFLQSQGVKFTDTDVILNHLGNY